MLGSGTTVTPATVEYLATGGSGLQLNITPVFYFPRPSCLWPQSKTDVFGSEKEKSVRALYKSVYYFQCFVYYIRTHKIY